MKRVDLSIFIDKIDRLCEYLDKNPDVDITELRDEKRNSILHITAFQNRPDSMQILVKHIQNFYKRQLFKKDKMYGQPVKQIIQDLVNDGNIQGYTALHYASLRGNTSIIKFLLQNGANPNIHTASNLNVLHSAAQGDSISSMLIFCDKYQSKFDLNEKDFSQSTALHWACYHGSESVVQFLLAQPSIEIDEQDYEGQTPLCIAVINGRVGIVKRLLIAGANRRLTNKKKQSPLQISQRFQFNAITKMLENSYTCGDRICFYFNKRMKYQPQQRSCCTPFLMIIMMLIVMVSTHALLSPTFKILYLYISAGANLLIFILFLSLLIQPSLPRKQRFGDLAFKLPICSTCCSPKKQRMQHCYICNKCISQYDHHCPWINGCVGKHNIVRFVLFLFLLLLSMAENFFVQILVFLQYPIFTFNYYNFGAPNIKQILRIVYISIFGLSALFIIIFVLPVFGLLVNQLNNICYNRTSYQKSFISHKKYTINLSNASSQHSATESLLYDRRRKVQCSCRNCGIMCG